MYLYYVFILFGTYIKDGVPLIFGLFYSLFNLFLVNKFLVNQILIINSLKHVHAFIFISVVGI